MAIETPTAPSAPGDRHDRRDPRRGTVPNRGPLTPPTSLPTEQTDVPADFGTMTTEEAVLADPEFRAKATGAITHERRPLQRRRHITVGGLFKAGILATAIGTGIYAAPKVVDWAQQQINTTSDSSQGGRYNLPAPSGRSIETPDTNQGRITPDKLPHIKQITYPKLTAYPGFSRNIGLDVYPEGGDKNTEMPVDAAGVISGYLVAKQENAKGEFDFFVEVPYPDGSDILNKSKTSTTPTFTETNGPEIWASRTNIKEDTAGGFIIDLKLFPGQKSDFFPLTSSVSYGTKEFEQVGGLGQSGTGPEALFNYAKVGDPIRAIVNLDVDFNSTLMQSGLKDYVSAGHATSVADAKAQMQTSLDQNKASLNQLKADNGKTISIADQLNNRYVFTPSEVSFLPQTP
jgi:hypothetical protein